MSFPSPRAINTVALFASPQVAHDLIMLLFKKKGMYSIRGRMYIGKNCYVIQPSKKVVVL